MPKNMPPPHPEAEHRDLMCGSCQWFSAGYAGNTCQKTREVLIDTPACQEFTYPLDDPFQEIVRDKFIRDLRQDILSERFIIQDTIIKELKGYIHELDLTQYSFGTQQDIEGISLFIKKIIYCRSRVSNIYTAILDVKYEFNDIIRRANMWLRSKYAIIANLRNESSRQAAFDRLIPENIEIQKEIEKATEVAEHVDNLLDATEKSCSKILSSSERLWFSKEKGKNLYGR